MYCSQFDTLRELTTVYEHLELIGTLKNTGNPALTHRITHILNVLDLTQYKDV